MSEPVEDWASVADAAAVFGVSERAIQRRCHSGKIRARLVPTATGQQWQIDRAALAKRDGDTSDRNDATGPTATPQTTAGTPLPTVKAATGTTPRPDTSDTGNDRNDGAIMPRYVAQLETENLFLRGVVEQQGRDAAELRAALREALKLSAKALPEGRVEADSSPVHVPLTKETGAAPTDAQRGSDKRQSGFWIGLRKGLRRWLK
jgi:hypothetical protein